MNATQLWNHCVDTVSSITHATGYLDCRVNETSVPSNVDDQAYRGDSANVGTGSEMQGTEGKQKSAGQIIKNIYRKQNKEEPVLSVAEQKVGFWFRLILCSC